MIRFDAIRIMRRWGSLRRCALSSADTLTACLLTALRLAYEQHIHMPDKPREMSTCARTKPGASLFGLSPSHLSAYESRRRASLGTQPQLRERCPFAAAGSGGCCLCLVSQGTRGRGSALCAPPAAFEGFALQANVCVLASPSSELLILFHHHHPPFSSVFLGYKDFRFLRQAATFYFFFRCCQKANTYGVHILRHFPALLPHPPRLSLHLLLPRL